VLTWAGDLEAEFPFVFHVGGDSDHSSDDSSDSSGGDEEEQAYGHDIVTDLHYSGHPPPPR
jgi:hypothetical protein